MIDPTTFSPYQRLVHSRIKTSPSLASIPAGQTVQIMQIPPHKAGRIPVCGTAVLIRHHVTHRQLHHLFDTLKATNVAAEVEGVHLWMAAVNPLSPNSNLPTQKVSDSKTVKTVFGSPTCAFYVWALFYLYPNPLKLWELIGKDSIPLLQTDTSTRHDPQTPINSTSWRIEALVQLTGSSTLPTIHQCHPDCPWRPLIVSWWRPLLRQQHETWERGWTVVCIVGVPTTSRRTNPLVIKVEDWRQP